MLNFNLQICSCFQYCCLLLRQAIKISYLHGIISENYTVVNQNLLQPYDKSCRSYYLFLSDVLRTREVLGPQIENRVVLVPRSTQWKLQEFLASKEASDIVNLLVVGESMTSDPSKVDHSTLTVTSNDCHNKH